MISEEIKTRARQAVHSALRKGTLIKPLTCEKCGTPGRRQLQAHHDDYLKPLEVRWLCHMPCHEEADNRIAPVYIRFDPDVLARLQSVADQAGTSVAAVIRACVNMSLTTVEDNVKQQLLVKEKS